MFYCDINMIENDTIIVYKYAPWRDKSRAITKKSPFSSHTLTMRSCLINIRWLLRWMSYVQPVAVVVVLLLLLYYFTLKKPQPRYWKGIGWDQLEHKITYIYVRRVNVHVITTVGWRQWILMWWLEIWIKTCGICYVICCVITRTEDNIHYEVFKIVITMKNCWKNTQSYAL